MEVIDKCLNQMAVIVGINDPCDSHALRLDDVEDKAISLHLGFHECFLMPLCRGVREVHFILVLFPSCDFPLNLFLAMNLSSNA